MENATAMKCVGAFIFSSGFCVHVQVQMGGRSRRGQTVAALTPYQDPPHLLFILTANTPVIHPHIETCSCCLLFKLLENLHFISGQQARCYDFKTFGGLNTKGQ